MRDGEARLERTSPLDPPRIKPRSALAGYYGNPQSPGPFESAIYPEIEAGPTGLRIAADPIKGKFDDGGGGANSENVTRSKAFDRGGEYEVNLISEYGLGKRGEEWKARNLKPDAITSDAVVEIKFTDDFTRSMYNAERKNYIVDREVDKSIEQALRYEQGSPPRKLIYYTNDWGLAEYYTRAFRFVGIADFKFVIVPAIRSSESPVGEDLGNEQ